MLQKPMLYMKLEVIFNNFSSLKINMVRDYIKIGDKLNIYTYYERLETTIHIYRKDVINVFVLQQKGKKLAIF